MNRKRIGMLVGLAVSMAWVVALGFGAWGLLASTDQGRTGSAEPLDAVAIDQLTTPDNAALKTAQSKPLEDSYYPDRGDPGVDTLHYGLDFSWEPDDSRLTGHARITLRAATDADHLQLDLLDALVVSQLTVDGTDARYIQSQDHLIIDTTVVQDQRYQLDIAYAGTPAPVPAPTTRTDVSNTGLTVTSTGEIWTMQEPFGAFTWYPVNDQPSDKALYDFIIRAPENWVGVANGVLKSRATEDGQTVTSWHLSEPASSYLTTLAVGDFVETTDESPSGVPMSYWTHTGADEVLESLQR
jgi:aminopeptidase N